jgi:hypothetical protein
MVVEGRVEPPTPGILDPTHVRARVFDMFPHTSHQEVLVLCERR